MAPGLPDISRLAPATAFAIPNAALQATQTFRNGNVSGLPWYKQLGASAMNDPITALRVTGGIAGLPGEMRKNDAEAELLKQQAEAAGMTVDQMRQQKANMDALRNALTARYNAR
jgi:hypothetical protein